MNYQCANSELHFKILSIEEQPLCIQWCNNKSFSVVLQLKRNHFTASLYINIFGLNSLVHFDSFNPIWKTKRNYLVLLSFCLPLSPTHSFACLHPMSFINFYSFNPLDTHVVLSKHIEIKQALIYPENHYHTSFRTSEYTGDMI